MVVALRARQHGDRILALSNPRGLATAKVLLDTLTTIDSARALAPWAS